MDPNWRVLKREEQTIDDGYGRLPFGAFAPSALQRLLIGVTRRTWLRRGQLRALMTRLTLALGPGKLDTRFRGAAFRIGAEKNLIAFGLLMTPEYNAKEIDFLLEGVAADGVFVDIGSNIGLYALPIAVGRPGARVLAIDANPKMVARLRWNAQASDAANLTVVHAAVSDHEGQGDLMIRKDDDAIVKLSEAAPGPIPVRTLAALIAQAGLARIDGLKIDIEGHEDEALAPFLDAAHANLLPRRIVIEIAHGGVVYPACAKAFARLGYQRVGATRNNFLFEREVRGA